MVPTHGALVLREEAYINQISTNMNIITNDDTCSEGKMLFSMRENSRGLEVLFAWVVQKGLSGSVTEGCPPGREQPCEVFGE